VRSFKIPNRKQLLLLTHVSLDSIAPVGSALRCIDELVDQLDTTEIEKNYDLESEQGREPFHPKTLIKVALYALHNCRFTLRKMEEDTQNHLGYKWLAGDEVIDHSTMGYFLSKYREQIVELSTQVVVLCLEQELVGFEVLAIDSVKIRANASYKQSRDLQGIKKEEQKIKSRLVELIGQVGGSAEMVSQETQRLRLRAEKLQKAKQILKQRAEGKQKQTRGKKHRINITDVDAHIMEQANGEKNPAYSITTATDTKSDIITHFQVNSQDDDAQALSRSIEGSRANIAGRHTIVEADSGFASVENLERLEADKQMALIPDQRMKVEAQGGTCRAEYDRSKFRYRDKADCYVCPHGKKLKRVGRYTISGRPYVRYANLQACRQCACRPECTPAPQRMIYRDQSEGLKEQMRHRLSLKRNQATYNRRAHAAESPYGHAKRNLRFICCMRRGIENVKMEMALVFMLHNLMRLRASET
jgi:transposase